MRLKKTVIFLFVLFFILSIVTVYLIIEPWIRASTESNSPASTVSSTIAITEPTDTSAHKTTPTPMPPPPEPVYSEAVWVGVGDIMSHSPQLPGAYNKETKKYDFSPFFEEVIPILSQGDWVMANLETPIAGSNYGYTGYPTFNAPVELAEALKDAGFQFLSTANNHSLDKGEKGLLNTLDHLKALGLQAIGTASSQQEADSLILSEKNGIRMGFLAYTYGTNGIPIPQGKPYLVALIDVEKIKSDIARLREGGADLVTVALHFGNEYQTTPSNEQLTLARSLVAAGADIIAGSHPHVVQPYEVIETFDDRGNPKIALILYSMGNFISNQRGDSKDYGVIFKVSARKNMTDETTTLSEVEAIPTWVHRYKPDRAFRYRVLPIEETLSAMDDELLSEGDYETMRKDYEMLLQRLEAMK